MMWRSKLRELGALVGFGLTACGPSAPGGLSSSASETSADDSETDTGDTSDQEPLGCGHQGCSFYPKGTLADIVGTSQADLYALDCVLQDMQTQWFPKNVKIGEEIGAELRLTELDLDGDGRVLVRQSTESEGYYRVESCELAPLDFFVACAELFTAECAQLDNWFANCTSDDFACVDPSCGLPSLCEEVPTIGPSPEGDASCVWAALRDADLVSGEVEVFWALQGYEYRTFWIYLDGETRSVGVASSGFNDIGASTGVSRCELMPASFFEACLDDPTPECNDSVWTWVESCVEAPEPCPA